MLPEGLRTELEHKRNAVVTALGDFATCRLQQCLELARALDKNVVGEEKLSTYYQELKDRHDNPYKGAAIMVATAVTILTSLADFKFFYVTFFSVLSYSAVHFVVEHYVSANPLNAAEKELLDACKGWYQTKSDEERYKADIAGSEELAEETMARGPQAPAAELVRGK
jgi:hypothetical protein